MYLPTPYKAGQPQYNTGCLNTNNAVKHNDFLNAAVCTCCILLRITFLAKAAQHRQSTMHHLISLVFWSSEITDKNTLFFKGALHFSGATLAALEVSITHPQRNISRAGKNSSASPVSSSSDSIPQPQRQLHTRGTCLCAMTVCQQTPHASEQTQLPSPWTILPKIAKLDPHNR